MNGDMSSAEPTNKTDIATNHFASRGIVDLASYRSVHYISSPEYLRQPGQTHLNCCKLLDISESIFNPMRSCASGERTRPRVQRVAPSRRASLANGYLDASALLRQRHRLDSAPFAAIENLLQAVTNEK
jgi:hypothetical protein